MTEYKRCEQFNHDLIPKHTLNVISASIFFLCDVGSNTHKKAAGAWLSWRLHPFHPVFWRPSLPVNMKIPVIALFMELERVYQEFM